MVCRCGHTPVAACGSSMTTVNEKLTDTTEEFAEHMVGAIDTASLAILLSIGHQTKLLDTLAVHPSPTSAQIADAAGLNERYVREWLGGVVTCRVVDYDPASQSYSLPRHRAAVLTRAAGPDNLFRVAQFISMFGEVEQKTTRMLRQWRRAVLQRVPRFHKVMAEDSGEVFDAALSMSSCRSRGLLTGSRGVRRRRRPGSAWSCHQRDGQGIPGQPVHRHRLLREGLAVGACRSPALGLTNAAFVAADVAALDTAEAYDVITVFDAIHDQAQPAQVLRQHLSRVAAGRGAADGRHQGVESPRGQHRRAPGGIPLHGVNDALHERVVGLDGAGLGTCWGRQLATSMLADAGFTDIAVHEIESDPINFYYVAGRRRSSTVLR